MNKFIILFCCFTLSIELSLAQSRIGARILAMGNNDVAIRDNMNFTGNFNNSSNQHKPILALGYGKYFFGDDISQQNIKLIVPLKNYEFGVGFDRYGINEYNEITAGVSLAKNFGNQFSIGLRTNYHQLKIQNYGATIGLSIDAGIMYHLNNQFIMGINIINVANQNYKNPNVNLDLPNTINFGASYQASNKILIATRFSKNTAQNYDFGLGLEYQLLQLISLRSGISLNPFKTYGGFGINYKKFDLGFAFQNDSNLGYASQIGLAYAF